MAIEVTLPNLGEGSPDQATVSAWLYQEGDFVSEGDDLVEMLTDKATFNVPAPVSGQIVEIRAPQDEAIQVGHVLCVIEQS